MRKAFVILCIVATLLTFPVCTKEYTHGIYEFTFSERIISNDSVGNDWKISYSCNGEDIKSGKQLAVLINEPETIVINITVTEKDKIPDIGTGSISVTPNNGSETKTVITVTERGGCNRGKCAQWEITCKVKLIKNT